ncbi:MAG: bifunctional 23S rRNA (guanine(2069)-N(7))-methyltransferase RlmK/23S rRNA (guanine(2445)-N(2))-methyltransferase RlmL [Alcanivorax sp.]|nr:bifunctional 23S rRNA (guanine(2069)-N(7))-methyltransferase RlmK/23S rRNA (guanine(2445)-N(2))-methyltransferase RlmL [Alcanivorax sp.]MAY11062.1 bifunctional 23S rRNA (guanine(2069)-N(7))-methyltransferase RlmK/23S rRNA (guanine(2445)-N(2))-methyltransferase RlmL [Alcanivorax sp.]MBI53004.1 bifunctional 23S rRNA (guanine(2069)-N(7))-methyltransferase RlmK/23S rRNA (guanine(2445)-N(2))-methyltransferase RlmL [Alcanivorax sp.]MBU60830.1 bifunctional 23S rRNA (guanine(2069)-N(7))-methyltransfe|tara:strand:- start:14640 stop:16751 length:2112 start_codon:yes stop_codon:yes gene_type:complete
MQFIITCLPGLAPLLADELTELGMSVTDRGNAHVAVEGRQQDGLRACLWSRLAERVLLPLAELEVAPEEAPEKLAEAVDWRALVPTGGAVHLSLDHGKGVRGDSRISAKRLLRGLPDDIPLARRETGACCLRARLDPDAARLWLDLAGTPLHRRGYRLAGGRAPLRENLAAALLRAGGWHRDDRPGLLVDPFCGSGTVLVEAAWMAAGIAPGALRKDYGFLAWRGCRQALAQEALAEAAASLENPAPIPALKGFDADNDALKFAQHNAERAGMAGAIHFERRELGNLRDRDLAAEGLMVTNPPWGERLDEQEQAAWLYAGLGRLLGEKAPAWRAVLLGGEVTALDRAGMDLEAQWKVRNGALTNFIRVSRPRPPAPREPLRVGEAPSFELPEPAVPLFNRLRKNGKHLRRWLDREDIQAYRLYDRDLPEFNVAVDIYGDQVLVQEFKAPSSVDPEKARQRRQWAVTATRAALGVHREQVHLRTRERQKGRDQYRKLNNQNRYQVVREGRAHLLVNLDDYLDTGLFLDHRPMRLRIAEEAAGKRFLNLFAYTGAATVQALAGGARRAVTVDTSRRYLDWAACNLALNGFAADRHPLVRADAQAWLDDCKEQFDLVFCDPPTFSNNKGREDFVVQEHHGDLIRRIMKRLEPGGVLYFSCNYRRFELEESLRRWYAVEDLTAWSLPEDFRRNGAIHHCYAIRHENN